MSAPILNTSSTFNFPALAEDDANSAGLRVSDIFTNGDVTDENGLTISAGIAISAVSTRLGQIQYKINETSSWITLQESDFSNNGVQRSLLLSTDAWLRLTPLANTYGRMNDALTFHAWNQTESASGLFLDISSDTYISTVSENSKNAAIQIEAVNDSPSFTSIQSGVDIFTEKSSAFISLATNVNISDIELSSSNNRVGNFEGSIFTLQRTDANRAEDVFSGINSLRLNRTGVALVNNIEIGSFTNSNGILSITFNNNATQSNVNTALSNIGYKNSSNAPENILNFTWTFNDGNSGRQGGGGALTTSTTSTINVAKINDAPRLTITSTSPAIYTEGGTPAIVAASARIYDSELASLNSGVGNYAGSKLTLTRTDGAHTEDIFSGTGTLSFNNNNVLLNGIHVGRVSNSSGLLTIIFNSNATQSGVNQVISKIGYSNTSNRPASFIELTWTFSDENTGDQGSNGSLSATNTSTINITPTDDTGRLSISGGTALGDTLRANISDPDGLPRNVRYQWLADGSTLTAASGGTLFLTAAMLGKAISVKAIYDDVFGSHTIISDPTAPVGGRSLTNDDDDYTGTSSIDWVLALDGNDYLRGNGSEDSLDGGNGNDTIDGGIAADHMMGGAGNDIYYVDNIEDIVTENRNEGIDTIFSTTSFILPTNVENLTLIGNTIINATGNSLNNRIVGNSASNSIEGFSGNDTLDGGIGVDTLKGGKGDDIYYLDNISDSVIELSNAGNDSIYSSTSRTLSANVENLFLTERAINGVGNILNNLMTGNNLSNSLSGGLGSDTLNGESGNDTLNGGEGNDFYYVDNLRDVIIESSINADIDTVFSTVTWRLGLFLENLTLTGTLAIDGVGNSANNEITGNSADNKLDGGSGNDTLSGGNGNDTYYIDSNSDVIIESSARGGIDTVITSFSKRITGSLRFIENITLIGTAKSATGNNLDNKIKGNLLDNLLFGGNGNDTIDGGIGLDTMDGGAGNDTYYVNSIGDSVIELADNGNDTVFSSISMEIGQNIENLKLEGLSVINGVGNDFDNYLIGNDANNLLQGKNGDDTLDGGVGIDTLDGGFGDDFYYIDNVNDIIQENSRTGGTDTIYSTVTRFLGANQENIILIGNSAIDANGNTLDNLMIGNSYANALNGGTGVDSMYGGSGNDIYYVDNKNDYVIEESINSGIDLVMSSVSFTLSDFVENLTLNEGSPINGTGNDLDNFIRGNSLKNRLTGSNGNDTLNGFSGADQLIGGNGNDLYIVDNTQDIISETSSPEDSLNDGIDTVQSYVTWTLGQNLENLTLMGSSSINGNGNSLDNYLTGNGGENSINGGAGNDVLDGGYGADTLVGGSGSDTYIVDTNLDIVRDTSLSQDQDMDIITSSVSWRLGNYIENLTLSGTLSINATGNNQNNLIIGNRGNNSIVGGNGNDSINGLLGQDTLTGGNGADIFIISASEDSAPGKATSDIITDFARGEDFIDLSLIDANTLRTGDQAFTRMITSTVNFTSAGQLKFYNGILYGNTDSDISAEFAIQITGLSYLSISDLIL